MLFGLFQVFFSTLVNDTAHLVARWMSVGFAHGVFWPIWMFRILSCPTSSHLSSVHQASATRTTSACSPSPSTTGRSASWIRTIRVRVPLSLKLPSRPVSHSRWHIAGFVPNSSDDDGRYSIGAQADVGRFNLGKLLRALRPVLTEEQLKEWEKQQSLSAGASEVSVWGSKQGVFRPQGSECFEGLCRYLPEEVKLHCKHRGTENKGVKNTVCGGKENSCCLILHL